MKTVKVKMRTATPIVMGGADNTNVNSSGLRAASIKGALRFWYRAMNIGDVEGEARIFGGQRNNGNQSIFLLKVTTNPRVRVANTYRYGSEYLAGQGLYSFNGGFQRPYIDKDEDIELTLHFKPNTSDADIEAVLLSIWSLSYFGGLGARSRRGFGSVQLLEIDGVAFDKYCIPRTRDDLLKSFKSFRDDLSDLRNDASYTAFTTETRIVVSREYPNSIEAMTDTSTKFSQYRTYRARVGHFPHYDPSAPDHDLVLDFINKQQINEHPKRIVFGLPQNYFYSSLRVNSNALRTAKVYPKGDDIGERRGSPLFIHVQKLNEDKSVVVYTLFPTKFLPDSARIVISSRANSRPATIAPAVDYNIIHRYLDAICASGGQEVKFNG